VVRRQVVQLDTAAEILELNLEATDSQNLRWQREFESIVSRSIESFLNNYNFLLEVGQLSSIFGVKRDLSFLINFDCVEALCLVILSRSVPISSPVFVQS